MVRSRNPWHDVTSADLDVLRDYLRPEADGAAWRADVMTPEAERALSEVVLVRLTYLYWPMLRERMRQILLDQNPLAEISLRLVKGAERHDALMRAAEGLLGDGLGTAFEHYPELGRLDGIFRTDLERLADEICAMVRTQRPAIAQQFFAGADVGRISSLSLPMNQDPRTRPGGRMRLFVDTEAGRFLYKPYDLAHHGAFERIAGWLFPELGLDTALLQADDALLQAGDAWLMAYVAQDLPKGGEELQSYARHAGLEIALFCALGSADLHRGNFIVRGTVPVPIDLEQLLPYPDVSIGVDAETWLAAQLFPDDKRLSFLRIPLGEGTHAYDYPDALLAGFAEGFARVMDCRTELVERLASEGNLVLRSSRGTPLDMAFRILHRSFAQDCLVSTEARTGFFEHVGQRVQGSAQQAIWAWERADMLRGDCPSFCLHTAGRGLYRPNGEVVIGDMGASPLEGLAQRLDLLSKMSRQMIIDELSRHLGLV